MKNVVEVQAGPVASEFVSIAPFPWACRYWSGVPSRSGGLLKPVPRPQRPSRRREGRRQPRPGAGGVSFTILDPNEGAVHRTADCLRFFAFLRAEAVAEFAGPDSGIGDGTTVSFLEFGHDQTPPRVPHRRPGVSKNASQPLYAKEKGLRSI